VKPPVPAGTRMRRPATAALAAATASALLSACLGNESATDDEASAQKADAPTALPTKVFAGYWQGWGAPSVRLGDVPEDYNVIMVAFAVGKDDDSGRARFSQSVQSTASFVADVDRLRAAGRPVLLSVGGWDDGRLRITTDEREKALEDSLIEIIDAHHFQGIDWDLEHGLEPGRVADVTHRLKAHYGADFAVTMAPPLDTKHEPAQRDLAGRIKDVLDLVNPQYYNGGRSDPTWIVGHARDWSRVVGPDKIGMGFMTVKTSSDKGEQTPAAVCSMWQELSAGLPEARGLMTWSINLDKTSDYRFARTCAQVLRAD
jgi:chitinase